AGDRGDVVIDRHRLPLLAGVVPAAAAVAQDIADPQHLAHPLPRSGEIRGRLEDILHSLAAGAVRPRGAGQVEASRMPESPAHPEVEELVVGAVVDRPLVFAEAVAVSLDLRSERLRSP